MEYNCGLCGYLEIYIYNTIFIKFYVHTPRYLQDPQLHLGPDQDLIKFLNVERFSEFLISLGSLCQILGPKLLSE